MRIKINKQIVTIVASIFLLNGCKKETLLEPNIAIIDSVSICKDTVKKELLRDWLIPLQTGNYWEYKVESLFGDDTIPIFTNYITHKVLNDFNAFKDCSLYKSIIYDKGNGSENQWVYWQDSTGYYGAGGFTNKDTMICISLLLKYPVNVGEQWEFQSIIYEKDSQKFIKGDKHTYSCVAKDEELSTPAGVFKCYVYNHRRTIADDIMGEYDIYDYFVPHVGQVGQVVYITAETSYDTISYLYSRAMLNKYNLQK